MRSARLAVCLFAVSLAACGRVDATRAFNHGLDFYDEDDYAAAIRAFEQAGDGYDDPAIAYNLALSHLAALRAGEARSEPALAKALSVVADARAFPDPSALRLAQLGYIEGSIHALGGDEAAARAAFEASLAADRSFRPALKALVELEPDADAPIARLVLSTAGVEPLAPERQLSR